MRSEEVKLMDEVVLRWKTLDRVSHLFLVLSFILGFLTGLPVFDYKLFGWLTNLVGGNETRAFIHHWVVPGLLLIAILASIAKFLQVRGTDAFPTLKDIKDLIALLKHWLGMEEKEPELGFHHPAEKFVFLAAFISVLIFAITGPIMVFHLGGWRLFLWARLFHSLAAMLMLVVLAGHFFMAISPANWSVLKAMFTDGKVSVKWAKKHSPKWLDEIRS